MLWDRVGTVGRTGRQYGGPEHQGKAIGKATEELDRRPLLVRIGFVQHRIWKFGRPEERPTCSSGWIKAEEEKE